MTTIYQSLYPDATPLKIKTLVKNKLFGGSTGSLWGEASSDFVNSIKGKVIIITESPNADGIFSSVEAADVAANKGITAINNIAVDNAQRTASGIISLAKSSFATAVSKGGIFGTVTSELTGSAAGIASETLARLGLSTAGATTAAGYLATGFNKVVTSALTTAAGAEAGTILAAAGSDALGLLGVALRVAGSPFVVFLTTLLSSSPIKDSVDQTLVVDADQALAMDTPDADQSQLVTTDADGTSVVNVPLDSVNGKVNDQYVLAEDPTTQTAMFAVATKNDSKLFLSGDLNGKAVLDEKIIDTLPNNAYDDQISITTDANGIIDVAVSVEKNDTVTVHADQTLTGVSQNFTFAGATGTSTTPPISRGRFPALVSAIQLTSLA